MTYLKKLIKKLTPHIKKAYQKTLGQYRIGLRPKARRLPKIYLQKVKNFYQDLEFDRNFYKNLSTKLYVPLILAALMFIFYKPSYAEFLDYESRLATYVVSSDVEAGTVTGPNGYTQVYFEYGGRRNVITGEEYPSGDPVVNREYIVWISQINGFWQIFRHHIPSKTTMQITHSANNANPKVSANGDVVWESWQDNAWQVFVFDGSSQKQISDSPILAQNADIEGDFVVFAEKNITGQWQSKAYHLDTAETKEIAIGPESRYPRLQNGGIYLSPDTKSQSRFPLTAPDLFLLNLETQNQSQTQINQKSTEEIMAEIDELIKESQELTQQNQELLNSETNQANDEPTPSP